MLIIAKLIQSSLRHCSYYTCDMIWISLALRATRTIWNTSSWVSYLICGDSPTSSLVTNDCPTFAQLWFRFPPIRLLPLYSVMSTSANSINFIFTLTDSEPATVLKAPSQKIIKYRLIMQVQIASKLPMIADLILQCNVMSGHFPVFWADNFVSTFS